jgi:hypothetical protein
VFRIFSTGDLIAIAIAVISSLVTVGVTIFVQLREDRRMVSAEAWRRSTDKQQRVEGDFASILLSSGLIQGMTGIFNWKRDESRTEAEIADLYEVLRRIQKDLQAAAVSLTLSGIKEPVEMVEELYGHFLEFRFGLARMGVPGEDPDLRKDMFNHKKSIDSLRERLEADLPTILKSLKPEPALTGGRLRWPWQRQEKGPRFA